MKVIHIEIPTDANSTTLVQTTIQGPHDLLSQMLTAYCKQLADNKQSYIFRIEEVPGRKPFYKVSLTAAEAARVSNIIPELKP